MLRSAIALTLAGLLAPRVAADALTVHGQVAPGGLLTLEAHGTPGSPVLLALGVGFSSVPVTVKGAPFHLDLGLPWFLYSLPPVQPFGWSSVPLQVPADPLLLGLEVHLHTAAPQLSPVVSLAIHEPPEHVVGGAALDLFGEDLKAADLDGDGRDDLLVGAIRGDGGAGEVGLAFGPSVQPSRWLADPTPEALGRFGNYLASGDLLGGPELDVVVSAPGANGGTGSDTGEVWVFAGPDFLSATRVPHPEAAGGSGFGTSLAVGDFDGDGDDDLAVGSPGSEAGALAAAGKVYIFEGGSLALWTTLVDPSPEAGALFGGVLCEGADFDGDGLDDLVVGVTNATVSGIAAAGEAWHFRGPLTAPPARIIEPHPSGTAAFGCRLKAVDLVGDGRPDLLVGVPGGAGTPAGNPDGVTLTGEVQVYDAGGSGLSRLWQDPSPEWFQHFGMDTVHGDFDGDGHVDIAVGAFLADLGFSVDAGEVFVFMGPDHVRRLEITADVAEAGAQFGAFMVAADTDGDGRDELVIAASRSDLGGFNAGALAVHGL